VPNPSGGFARKHVVSQTGIRTEGHERRRRPVVSNVTGGIEAEILLRKRLTLSVSLAMLGSPRTILDTGRGLSQSALILSEIGRVLFEIGRGFGDTEIVKGNVPLHRGCSSALKGGESHE